MLAYLQRFLSGTVSWHQTDPGMEVRDSTRREKMVEGTGDWWRVEEVEWEADAWRQREMTSPRETRRTEARTMLAARATFRPWAGKSRAKKGVRMSSPGRSILLFLLLLRRLVLKELTKIKEVIFFQIFTSEIHFSSEENSSSV